MKNYFFFALIIASCQSGQQNKNSHFISHNQVKYAKGFALETFDNYTKVEVYNPWANNAVLSKYVFVNDSSYSPLENEVVVHVPVSKGVFLSSTYLGMIAMLDAREVVTGCTNPNWIYDSILYSRYLAGHIKHLGSDIQVTAEKVIGAKPDVVMKYIYQGEDPADKMIKEVGIPIVYNIEFMENSPLGRAEWIKLVGTMLGKFSMADSLFNEIEEKYLSLKELAKTSQNSPSVLDGSSFKGTWYAAGGKSFVAQLIQDANATYYWAEDTTQGSLPLSFEVVLQKQGGADYWLNCNASALNEILVVESRCELLESFKNKNVYHFNKRVNLEGGFDYYETGVIRPDLVLHDLLVILHPELFSENKETFYYEKLD
jgi:iron complex transport system substrate-binding protein